MASIGAEVGQKMRSAIKAKLMELNCYVDDELPDYIMVMVANKRTKSQMNEDLQLFLTNKTSTFVDWLHIVLKKLKEVSVTNPEVYKRGAKRKSDELTKSDVKVKKEKKEKIKSEKKSKKKETVSPVIKDIPQLKSLTDDLPININKLQEKRKIMIMQENQNTSNSISSIENVNEDSFDIPLLSQVNLSNESELEDIERKIRNVKSRLGLLVESESDDDFINIKAEPEDLFPNEVVANKKKESRKIKLLQNVNNSTENSSEPNENSNSNQAEKTQHARITFNSNSTKNNSGQKKKSVLERLGKRPFENAFDDNEDSISSRKTRVSLSEYRKEEEKILGSKKDFRGGEEPRNTHKRSAASKSTDIESKKNKDRTDSPRESILNRLGVMSKVSVPIKEVKEVEEPEEELIKLKEVPSIVKVKPRVIPPIAKQANKNLLLKAVAEAQRSIAQTPNVGSNIKPDALFTKKYKEKMHEEKINKKIPEKEKAKIKNILVQVTGNSSKKHLQVNEPNVDEQEREDDMHSDSEQDFNSNKRVAKHQFIVTLDGIDESKFKSGLKLKPSNKIDTGHKDTEKQNEEKTENMITRKTPSPIIFDNVSANVKPKPNIPDKLPVVHPSPAIKNKERCKYWPICRQGEKCEFVHPTVSCKMFPQCKFGDKCLYIHPTCKFEKSCTRRDCPYSHISQSKPVVSRVASSAAPTQLISPLLTCKYFPNCSNPHCTYYHPKACKYGKYCKNQAECNFLHSFVPKSNFTWRSNPK